MVAKIRPVRVTRGGCDLRVDFLKLAPSRDFETSSRAVKKLEGATLIRNDMHDYSGAIWNQYAAVNFLNTTNCTRPTGSCNFVSLRKIYSCLFIPNCTRNHMITYTK